MGSTLNLTEQFCPICSANAVYIFKSKHSKAIFECSARDCGHFFTPMMASDQGICARDEDLERE